MKKFGLLLFVFLLTACGGDLSSSGENVSNGGDVKISDRGGYDQGDDGGLDEDLLDNGENSEDLSDDDFSDIAVDDFSTLDEPWADCYRDILANRLPYLVYTGWDGKEAYDYLDDLYGDGDISFALYDHKDFTYPLLLICYKLDSPGEYQKIYALVSYKEDGSYVTFSNLEPGQFTQFSHGIYEDGAGNLFIDEVGSEDIFAINKVGDKLLINYCYRPFAKGFATKLSTACLDDEGDFAEPDYGYEDGSPDFLAVGLVDSMAEDFSPEEYNDFKNSLREIPMTSFDGSNLGDGFAVSDDGGSDFGEADVFDDIKNGSDYGSLSEKYDDENIFNLIIDGKDMGEIGLLSFGNDWGVDTYTDVGYLNMKLVELWKNGIFADDKALAEMDGKDSTAYVKQHEGGWYYGVFPGAMEFYYDYYNFYNVTLLSFYDFYEEDTIYAIKHPAETAVFDEDSMGIDIDTLSQLFGFSYDFDIENKALVLDTTNFSEDNSFVSIARDQYANLEDLLEDNFGENGKVKYQKRYNSEEKIEEDGEELEESQEEIEEETKEDKEAHEVADDRLLKNIINIKPKVTITKDGDDNKWDETTYINIEIKNKKDYPEDAKFIISSKYIDNKKVDEDGYYINGGPYEIETKKKLAKKKDDYIEEIKIKVFYGDKWSDQYSYYYNPALSYFEKEMAKNGLKDDYNKVIDNIKKLRDYDPIVYDKNDKKYKYREEYAFIIPEKTGNPKSPTEKALVRQWFTLANNMQLKEYSKALENVKGNKVNKSNLGIFGKMFPWARSIEIANNITEIISVENNKKIVNQDGREYLLKIDSIGVGAALTTGKIYMREGEDWKEMRRIGLLTATPKVDDASIKFTENYIIALGFQSLGGIINKPGLVKMATQTNFERGVSFAQYIDGLTKFSDKILESNLKKYDLEDLSKILGLTSNGKDFFSYLDTLKRMNTNLNKNTQDLSLEDTREMVDDSVLILKYLGKI